MMSRKSTFLLTVLISFIGFAISLKAQDTAPVPSPEHEQDIIECSTGIIKSVTPEQHFPDGDGYRLDNRNNQPLPLSYDPSGDQASPIPNQPYFSEFTLDQPAMAVSGSDPDKEVQGGGPAVAGDGGVKAWNLITTQDFEGTFPSGLWSAYATTGYADAYWDDANCRANTGSWSAWCADAGTQGVSCFDNYPNDMLTYMKYGPFDLSDASHAYINFYKWLNCEADYDQFAVYVSINDYNYYGYFWTGLADSWELYTFDLTNVYTLGNLCGQPEVWMLIKFSSDFTVNAPEGAYVDDIEIWKDDSPGGQDLGLSGGSFSPNPVSEEGILTISVDVINNGTGPASNSEMQYYLSTDNTINGSDCYLGNDFVTLAPGGTVTHSINADLSAIACASPGTYYVGVYFVDEDNGWYWTTTLEVAAAVNEPEIDVSPTSLTIYEEAGKKSTGKQGKKSQPDEITGDYVQGHLLVKFEEDVAIDNTMLNSNSESLNQLFASFSVDKIEQVFPSNNKNVALKAQFGLHLVYRLRFDASLDIEDLIAAFQADPQVVYAEPDYLYVADLVPDDPLYPQQWGLKNTGQAQPYGGGANVGTPGADINAEPAWDIQTGSSGVTVAILDEGVDLAHPEFDGRLLPGYDFFDNDNDPSPVGDGAHGTACAGIAAAANDGVGTVGVAWNVMILPVRVLGPSGGSNTQVSNGITFAADEGAHIISMSLGGPSYSSTMNTAINYAYALDVVVLASAGNNNSDNGTTPQYPACYDNCISVGALSPCNERKTPSTCDGEFWWGSNYGGGLDFMAPGTRIYTTDISGSAGYSSSNYTSTFNGTSSACPFAAGIAALLKSENPDLTNAEIWSVMQATCVDLGAAGYDDDTGHGRLNAYEALLMAGGGGTGNEFMIQNLGNQDLTITSITDAAAWMSTSGYPATPFVIAPGSGQNVTVDVNWTLLGGVQSTSNINIASDDPDEPSVEVSVTAIPLSLPDLVVADPSVSPSPVLPGAVVSSACTVLNEGSADAEASTLEYFLSLNTTWEATDVFLGSDNVPALASGASSAQSEDLVIPPGTVAGDWYVLFFADAGFAVDESNEDNNVSWFALEVVDPFITLDPYSEDVGPEAGSTSVDVSANIDWTVDEGCDWVSVTPAGGSGSGSMTVTYQENISTEPRSCEIEVLGAGANAFYTLNQAGTVPFLAVDPASEDVGPEAGSTSVDVSANIDWTVDEGCDWVSVAPATGSGNGSVTVTYDENLSIDPRSCTVEVSGEGLTATYVLNQAGGVPFLSVDPVSEDVVPEAGSTTVNVNSNVDWTVNETCDWVSVTPASGSGSGSVTVTYEENLSAEPRSCIIEVSGDGASATFTLNQAGAEPYLTVDPFIENVGPAAGSATVDVSSNVVWTVDNPCDWVSVDPMSGSGNGSLTVTYDENLSVEGRFCFIEVSGNGVSATYNLMQAGADPYIVVDPISDDVGASSGNTTVDISANVPWSVDESCDWVSVSPPSGSGNGSIWVSYEENLGVEPRSCTIEVNGPAASDVYTLNQAGADPFLTVEPGSQSVGYQQGSFMVDVSSNLDWTVSESCDWVSVDPPGGSGSGSLTVAYDQNTSTEIRFCTITVEGGGMTADVIVEQDGTTGIATESSSSGITMFPNPVDHTLTMEFKRVMRGTYAIILTDMLGNIVLQKELEIEGPSTTRDLDVRHLSSGVYNLRVTDIENTPLRMERIIIK